MAEPMTVLVTDQRRVRLSAGPGAGRGAEPGRGAQDGAPAVLDLPRDWARPPVQSHHCGVATATVPAAIGATARLVAAVLDVPPGTVLLAAFAVLLARLSGHADLVIGLRVSDREEFGGAAGNFSRLLPVGLRVDDDADFAAHVHGVEAAVAAALADRDAAVDRLAAALPRDLSRAPLVQVVFDPSPASGRELDPPRDTTRRPAVLPPEPAFDLTLSLVDRATLRAAYNPDLYRPERIDALLDSYVVLLAALAGTPARPVRSAPARSPGPGRLPDPVAPLPPAATAGGLAAAPGLVERIRRRAAERPDALAVQGEGGTVTYAQLEVWRAALGAALRHAGVVGGEVVGVLAGRTVALPAVLLGVLGSGARWLLLDPALPPGRLARQAAAARLRVLVTCPGTVVPADLAGLTVVAAARPAGPAAGQVRAAPPAAAPAERGYLMATSGTTGEPALVTTGEGPLARFLAWYADRFEIGASDATALLGGLAHDALLRDAFATLVAGGRVHVPLQRLLRDPDGLLAWLAASRVTIAHLTPQLARMLARGTGTLPGGARPAGPLPDVALPDLRLVVFAGDTLSDADARAVHRLAPRAVLVNAYGTTETPQVHAYAVVSPPPPAGVAPQPVPVGFGVEGGSQLILISPAGTPAAVGELAEIFVRSRNLAAGYLRADGSAAGLRAAGFGANPFTADERDRVYATGDLGRYDPDGAVVVAGRRDHQVTVRGYRVELGEVAAALRQHPGVADAAVVARTDATGETSLAGYVVPRRASLRVQALRELLVEQLPEYARPATVQLMPELPLTPGGKLDQRALAEPATAPPPARGGPGTPTERRVAAAWREVLGVPGIRVTDNFFEIGGHSLAAAAVHARLAPRAGRRLRLADLFQYPTIRGLAAYLDGAGADPGLDRAARRIAARSQRTPRDREQR